MIVTFLLWRAEVSMNASDTAALWDLTTEANLHSPQAAVSVV